MTLVKVINSILDVSKKTTTLKFATLLSIFDYVIDHPEEKSINNFHFIPIIYLAKQFLSYYYPLSFYKFSQGTPVGFAIYTYIRKRLKNSKKIIDKTLKKALKSKAEGIIWINQLYDSPEPIPNTLLSLLWYKIRRKILDQPLKFIPNVAGATKRFFGIVNTSTPFNSEYHIHRKNAKAQKPPKKGLDWLQLFDYDETSIIIDDITYKELAQYRFWIRDVITKKWFEFSYETEDKKNRQSYDYGEFFNILNLAYKQEISRDSALISAYKNLYIDIGSLRSIFTGKLFNPEEDEFHLDHFLPWSYYRVNRFWNLYPLEPDKNREKSNYLPHLNDEIEERIRKHLEICLTHKQNPLIQNDLRYFYFVNQKKPTFTINTLILDEAVDELFIAIKKDLKNLKQIIPGKLYDPNN